MHRRQISGIGAFTSVCWFFAAINASAGPKEDAVKIIEESGVQGGLIVHLGAGDGQLTAALRANDSYQVHGLEADKAKISAARKRLLAEEVYGPVSIDQLRGERLPYIENMVNLIVAESDVKIPQAEFLRVLVPGGVAMIRDGDGWKKTTKPPRKGTDEWTHYLHDSDGNPVAHDELVGPPRHLQWVGSPRWSRHHDRMASMSALVSTNGRIFYIMDEGSRVSIQLPSKWALIARDAYNGVVLWKQPIKKWHSRLWPLKSGPTQLARRLVAVDDTVYTTLSIDAPCSALDAATGEIIRTYEGTQATEEIIASDGVLFLLVNKGPSELSTYAPEFNVGDQKRVASEFGWNEKPRIIMAIDADSGKLLWKKENKVAPLTMAADSQRVVFHDGDKVVCLDRQSGKESWHSEPVGRRSFLAFNFGPRLLIHEDIVLYAGGDRKMHALNIDTGKEIWNAPHERSGYQSPEDLLVAGGLVWNAPTTSGRDSGVFTGRDPKTGEVKKEFPPDVSTYWFHHRCYIAKATDNFLIPSRTGIEFVDQSQDSWDINHWVRGGCLYGVMPCNGLVYAPPHDCACYPEAKIYGLNALAPSTPSRQLPKNIPNKGRLERGPAFGKVPFKEPEEFAWSTYRGNEGRSGYTEAKVSAKVRGKWHAKLGGNLTSVVVADGKLFVAQKDQHTLHALDAETGMPVWSYTTGGRIDSPPTIYRGRALFGSADGWVYCLRVSDGELVWRFQAAPIDQRHMAFEQLESVWPVHGNVLIHNFEAWFVAGRSNFLDGGLRVYRLNYETGEQLSVTEMNETDPETGKNIQERIQTLQMPAGLSDILVSKGENVYLKSQKFDKYGKRLEIGPHSGQAQKQGSVQRGEETHVFAPMGFLDGSWFHRSYWVFGRSFAGGHNGYYQAGKHTPSGRILVVDDERVYAYGRLPEYYRWTTPLEHQLFSASNIPPEVPEDAGDDSGVQAVRFENTKSLDPTKSPLTVEAWVYVNRPNGVIVARGGPSNGYALVVNQGKPAFILRTAQKITRAAGNAPIGRQWVHVAGVLTEKKELRLYVNGEQVATAQAPSLIPSVPLQGTEIGADLGGSVGNYRSPYGFTGTIDEVRIYHRALSPEELVTRVTESDSLKDDPKLVLACTFENGKATDQSGKKNNGTVEGPKRIKGQVGQALAFVNRGGNARRNASLVERDWAEPIPIFARAMVLANDTIFVAGPPDLMDEEETFKRIQTRDPEVDKLLARQDEALEGAEGALILSVSKKDGKMLGQFKLPSIPVWDGMAAMPNRIYVALSDGSVVCLEGE